MKKVGYAFALCFVGLIGIMPFGVLYLLSDINAFLLYHVVRYRRKVVRENLTKAFPEKSLKEIKSIEKRNYRNLCDLFAETCKLLYMKPEQLAKRVKFVNPELVRSLYDKGRSVFTAMPHSGNWEWYGKLMHTVSKHKASAIYKRIENDAFERLMKKIRTSYGIEHEHMIESRMAFRDLVKRNDMTNSILIIADQSPRGVETDYWNTFLNQETCWFTGMEKMAKKLDYAVVFVAMKRVKRGYYEVRFNMICEDARSTADKYIIERYSQETESFIRENNDNWLWTHRRWKHKHQKRVE